MKIVFLSNYYNHHQKYICDAFYKILGDEFAFIETEKMSKERVALGYSGIEIPEYVKYYFENNEKTIVYQKLIDSADVIIFGSAPEEIIESSLKNGKIIFRYSERPIKEKQLFLLKYPVRFIKWRMMNRKSYNTYLLCASAFTAHDYKYFGLFKNRAYKWGYFPKTYYYDDINKLIEKKKKNSILWVARMLQLKNPQHAIEVARRLHEKNIDFELNMIGIGEKLDEVKELIHQYSLENNVKLIGAVTPDIVRKYMEESEIFLFTSDHNEGWGAVLNEAMNSACAVVVNARIGSVPYLTKNMENALLYNENDVEKLVQNTEFLIQNRKDRKRMAYNAYHTIVDEWNAENAVNKFMRLLNKIMNDDCGESIASGVCSQAELIKDAWFEKERSNNAKF